MRRLGLLGGKRRAVLSIATVTAFSVTIATLAVLYEGYTKADVDLTDGGVWVTATSDLMVGHLNHPSRVLDSFARDTSPTFDVLQDGSGVLVIDAVQGVVKLLDPARSDFLDAGRFTPGSEVAFRAGTVGLVDSANNGLYASSTAGVQGLSVEGQEPLAELGAGATVTVSTEGTIYATSRKGELVTIDELGADPVVSDFADFPADALLHITAVGQKPVVFDAANGTLYVDGRSIPISGGVGGRLQYAGPDNDLAVVATRTGLVLQPLDGDEAVVRPVPEGDPSEPVWLAGCAYAVWSGSGQYIRDCIGEADDRDDLVPDYGGRSDLILRQNRNVVVINDVDSGTVWLVNQDMQKVENWDDILPPPDQASDEDESQDEDRQFTMPQREKENHPPKAVADTYGVRPGLTTVLPVLDNDTDQDGDLLTASLVGEAPPFTTVTPIRGGAALQIEVNPNASGSLSFQYEANDGRNGTDTATVNLTVLEEGAQNRPPQQKPDQRPLVVEVGASITYDVLPGWIDPDGDDIYLKRAWSEEDDKVSFRSNGVIEFTDALREEGVRTVHLLVTDGRDEQAGDLVVQVRAKGSQPPVPNADRYSATIGVPITLTPLTNDLSPNGATLQLANFQLDEGAGVTVTPDYQSGTLIFQANTPGTYYLQYLVSNGPSAATGLIRVDVIAQSEEGLDPIAARDTALLPQRREVLVDVLANDIDPAGGILVVQSVTVPESSRAVSAEVLEHRILRLKDAGGLATPVTIQYTVSNGLRSATGEVRVLPVELPEKLQPPVAVADRGVVRAGDVVTIDVLANDYHPDGDTITLMPEFAEEPAPADGEIFVADNKVRFRAGAEAKSVRAVYRVIDSQKNVNSATVTIQIYEPKPETNSAPRPLPVTARTLQGSLVRIPVPLEGIDPDGDSVELVGTGTAPRLGRVNAGDTWLEYTAFPDAAGMDSFEYVVRDRYGATASGSVVVGVAVPANQNQAPYTATDLVEVKPGRRVSVPVLQNDSDPDGDDLLLKAGLPSVADGVEAEVVKDRVVVHAPQAEGSYPITYRAADVFGAESDGELTITVSAEAAGEAPIARDDRVQPATIGNAATLDVAVLDNDEDPDGVVDDLTVSTSDENVAVLPGGVLQLAITPEPRIVLYTITDLDGMQGKAFVFVPGTATLLPSLKVTDPVEVVAGETVSLPLADHVAVRPGRDPRLAVAELAVSHASATAVDDAGVTLSYTAAADYFGPDALSFQVTDGTGPDDPEGLTAYLSIPILVIPAENQPPSLRNTSVQVEPGGEAVEVNLRRLASDPNKADLENLLFEVTGKPGGITADVDGFLLHVSADSGVEENSTAEVTVRASDPEGASGAGTVTVRTTSSLRELPTATDDYAEAYQGQTDAYPVLDNDHNPFRQDGKPLTIVDVRRLSGDPGARIDHDGTRISVTPSADFHGTIVISYTIQDATGIAERQAEGTLTVVVQGRPDRPDKPIVNSVGDMEVVLSWTPPAHNGRPITGYTVQSVSGPDYTRQCSTTTCTLNGLTNNKEYTFSVTATNDVGTSAESPASAVARPDVIPDTPGAPTLEFGDQSLSVKWSKPKSRGSPVTSYTLRISPAAPNGRTEQVIAGGTSFVWEGLTNGQAYRLQVQAHNLAGGSEWSQYSAPEVPAREPDPPAKPSTKRLDPVGSQAQLQVAWGAPANNGDTISRYTLRVLRGGSVVNTLTVAGDKTSQAIALDVSTTDYTFDVAATNKAGTGARSPQTNPRRAFTAPGAPTNVRASPGNNKVTVTYNDAPGNGAKSGEIDYEYSVNGGGWRSDWDGRTIGNGQADNNSKVRVRVRAHVELDGVRYNGPASGESNEVAPYGPVRTPSAGASANQRNITFSWSPPSRNGRDIARLEISIDGGGWENVGAGGGSRTNGYGYSETHSIRVRAIDTEGQVSELASASARTVDPPQPSVTVYNDGYAAQCDTNPNSRCYWLGVETRDFSGNVTCTVNGGYATTYGANDRKRMGSSSSSPYFGTNYPITVKCGSVTWSGGMP